MTVEITPWHWIGFILCVLFFLALDLGLFHRRPRVVKFKEAAGLERAFGLRCHAVRPGRWAIGADARTRSNSSPAMSSSFRCRWTTSSSSRSSLPGFRVPPEAQHRAAVLGHSRRARHARRDDCARRGAHSRVSLDALRCSARFSFSPAPKCCSPARPRLQPEKNLAIRLARQIFPVSPRIRRPESFASPAATDAFALTPLALVLLLVETTDLIFAVDSIPAVFAVTTQAFIVFTSNVFAILGLRSLYFLLVGAIGYFRYLKIGLSVVLVFVGVKMLLDPHGHEPQVVSDRNSHQRFAAGRGRDLFDFHRAVRHRRPARKGQINRR